MFQIHLLTIEIGGNVGIWSLEKTLWTRRNIAASFAERTVTAAVGETRGVWENAFQIMPRAFDPLPLLSHVYSKSGLLAVVPDSLFKRVVWRWILRF